MNETIKQFAFLTLALVPTVVMAEELENLETQLRALSNTEVSSALIVAVPIPISSCVKCVNQSEQFFSSIDNCRIIEGKVKVEIRLLAVHSIGQFNAIKRKYELDSTFHPDIGGKLSRMIHTGNETGAGAVVCYSGRVFLTSTTGPFDCTLLDH